MKKLWVFIVILILGACVEQKSSEHFLGFWQGPHPTDQDKKFYVHIQSINDTIKAKGYWTLNNFYQSEFEIDSVAFLKDGIGFYVPDWDCHYYGKLIDPNKIEGGFNCENEPFDSVNLFKNDDVARFLILPKADFHEHYKYSYYSPEQKDDLIETARYDSDKDSMFINEMVTEIVNGDYGRLNSFLLIKNNKLICEEYFFGYTKNDLHQIESSTKSISSLLIGIAKDQGYINDIQEPLYEIFPDNEQLQNGNYRKIRIDHLLSMSSGFKVKNDQVYNTTNLQNGGALKRDLVKMPGEKFAYDGGNTEILGDIIKHKTGYFADEFAAKNLFKPLKIEEFNWEDHKQQGYPLMAGALWLKPRDMAKIGLLVLNKGEFAGKQIVSANWINESTTKKIATHIQGDDYAYHWWNIHLKSIGKTYNCIWANGWGSQFIYIIPELEVVIVTTGYNYENNSWAITAGIEKYLYLLD